MEPSGTVQLSMRDRDKELSKQNRKEYGVEPWSPYHFLEKFFFSISFVVKMPVWSEKHFWSQKKGTLL